MKAKFKIGMMVKFGESFGQIDAVTTNRVGFTYSVVNKGDVHIVAESEIESAFREVKERQPREKKSKKKLPLSSNAKARAKMAEQEELNQ